MFWDKEIETLDRGSLEQLQLKRLCEMVQRVAAHVPFYQYKFAEAGVDPTDIRGLDDLRRLPFTTNADLRATYPRGLVATPPGELLRLHTSSGTTGKPKALFFSRNDVDNAAALIARAMTMTGVTTDDIFQNMMTYGLFTGALVMHYGAEKVGCLVIPAGPGNSEKQLLLMQDFRSTVVHVTPSYALYFAGFTGVVFVLTLYLQNGLGYTPLEAGLSLTPFALGSAVSATIGGRLVSRMGRSLVVIGLVVVGLGLGATDLVLGGHHGAAAGWWLALPMLIAGVGGGLVISPNVTLTLANVPVHQAGAAGGVLNTGQRLGTAAGIAVIGSLFFSHLAATGDSGGAAAIGLRATLAFISLALVVGIVDLARGRSRDREPQPASGSPAR